MAAARPPPRGEGADFPVLHPPRVGQSPEGSLARPSRPHLRPGPGEPVRWARPPCGGAPPLGPFSAPAPPPEVGGEPSLHPPSVAPAARLEPPPQATGTYWPGLLGRRAHLARDGRGCGALVATYPPIRPGAAGVSPSRPARPPGLPDPAGIRRFRKGVHRPMFSKLPFRGGLLPAVGGEPEARPSPQLAPRPALRVEAPRVPVQAFGPRRRDVALRDTAGQQVPRREPLRSAYSPGLPLWCGRLCA